MKESKLKKLAKRIAEIERTSQSEDELIKIIVENKLTLVDMMALDVLIQEILDNK